MKSRRDKFAKVQGWQHGSVVSDSAQSEERVYHIEIFLKCETLGWDGDDEGVEVLAGIGEELIGYGTQREILASKSQSLRTKDRRRKKHM